MQICLTVLNGESSKSNGKSFTNSSTLMLVRKFLLMADNRLELPCGEPLVEVCLPCKFRYPVCFSHGLMYECQCSTSLSQSSIWTCSNYSYVEFCQYFYCAVKNSSVQTFYIFIFLCIAKRSIFKGHNWMFEEHRQGLPWTFCLSSSLCHAPSISTFLILCDHFSLLFCCFMHWLLFLAGLNLLLLSSCIVSGLSRKICDRLL